MKSGTTVLRYGEEVLQRDADECLYEQPKHRKEQAPAYTAKAMHHLDVALGYSKSILNSMHNAATDHRSRRLHSKTPPAKKLAPLTTLSSSLCCE